jgi:hypothetical protein
MEPPGFTINLLSGLVSGCTFCTLAARGRTVVVSMVLVQLIISSDRLPLLQANESGDRFFIVTLGAMGVK